MDNRRTFNRWDVAGEEKMSVSCAGLDEKVDVLDISAGGMRISFPKPVEVGAVVRGEFTVIPKLGPYFIKGTVSRVTERDGAWEAAVEFNKIRAIPFSS